MGITLLAARLLLAAVFAVAALTKVADRAGTRQAIMNFGLPALLVGPLGILLPAAELAVAVALAPAVSAWWGAIGAFALLLLFIAGIGVNLARGRRPDCHCFGQLHSEPVGWPTLARNAALAVVALFVIWVGRGNAGLSVLSPLPAAAERIGVAVGVVGGGALVAEAWFLVHLLGRYRRLQMRVAALEDEAAFGGGAGLPASERQAPAMDGLPLGAPAPDFQLSSLDGEAITLTSLRAGGKPVMLVFAEPDCGPCAALLPDVARWQREASDKVAIAVVSGGTPEANRAKVAGHGVTCVLLQQGREVAEAYQANWTPCAVTVHPNGKIASRLAVGGDAIWALAARTVTGPTAAPLQVALLPPRTANGGHAPDAAGQAGLSIGDPAPALKLPDLSGKDVDLAEFRGRDTLVLFWNPGCGFCSAMLDDLKAWEAHPPQGAPQLLVVSAGTMEANQAQGLRSPVVLDQGFAVGRAFGANGTPNAVLVDAGGAIASEVVIGAPAALALAGRGLAEPVGHR